jgi:alanine dehydrogenase
MKRDDFKTKIVADITCDINGSIPCTIKATTVDEPFFCFNPQLEIKEPPFSNPDNITVMSIDNLASELPRDASLDFGNQLIAHVLDELFSGSEDGMIKRATITKDGRLTPGFEYLSDYLNGDR